MNEIKELYIEPTSHCNLNCVMCVRNQWKNETIDHMDLMLFEKVINEIPDSVNRIFFGGMGEPLCHPEIIYMIRRAKETGRRVEMITNGTILNSDNAKGIVNAGLDMLWISLDSLEEKSYEHIRSGAEYKDVIGNIRIFNEQRGWLPWMYLGKKKPKLGVAFVVMKRNLPYLTELLEKSRQFGIAEVKATHLLPYDESQVEQICYARILNGMYDTISKYKYKVHADIPFLDSRDVQQHNMFPVFANDSLSYSSMGDSLQRPTGYCKFVQEGLMFVRWDGAISPCMALLHDNTVYQQDTSRFVRHCSFGNAHEQSLMEIWNSESYSAFRQRVIDFDFSPCIRCGPCELFESNEEDCFGNPFPTCGPCLWAQGLVQCP